jgi:hypothetical protein
VDSFMANFPDALVLFGAGNHGAIHPVSAGRMCETIVSCPYRLWSTAGLGGPNTVMTPGLSKNGLTVGSTYGLPDFESGEITGLTYETVTPWSGKRPSKTHARARCLLILSSRAPHPFPAQAVAPPPTAASSRMWWRWAATW